jgi:hypothetical protein
MVPGQEMDSLKTPADQTNPADDCIMQDGVVCPRESPWSGPSRIEGLAWLAVVGLGLYILVLSSIFALAAWLLLIFTFVVPLRYLICARCPYYGQECHNGMAKMVTYIFKKQEGKSMVFGLWLDVVLGLPIAAIPLYYAWTGWGWIMVLAWVGAVVASVMAMTRFGCLNCPFTFCPIGKAGRALWNK